MLANIYLHVPGETWSRKYAHLGTLVRYADDFVILCRSRRARERAEKVVGRVFEYLKLRLHPDKTKRVDLSCELHDLVLEFRVIVFHNLWGRDRIFWHLCPFR